MDSATNRIYWANANPVNVISWANLNGSGGGNINTTGATVDNPHGVAIDPLTNRIYWANVGANLTGQTISWASLSGSGGGNLVTTGATVSTPVGVAIDTDTRRIYWGNWGANSISWANLDGSGGGNLSTPGATKNGSRSPALLKTPVGTGAPSISGGTTIGSVAHVLPGIVGARPARPGPVPRARQLRLFLDAQRRDHRGRQLEHPHDRRRRATIAAR